MRRSQLAALIVATLLALSLAACTPPAAPVAQQGPPGPMGPPGPVG